MITLEALRTRLLKGGLCIVVDDADRENEGDLVALGSCISHKSLNTMARIACGLICVPIGKTRAEAFGLHPQVQDNEDPHGTAFTVSVDGKNTGTGISIADRLASIRILAMACPDPGLLRKPGHVFPLVGKPGGLLERRGHTEAALTLTRLCGTSDCGVICEILQPDGGLARGRALESIAQELDLPIIDLDTIKTWETVDQGMPTWARLPTEYGQGWIRNLSHNQGGVVYLQGTTTPDPRLLVKKPLGPLVRIHSECLTGDVFTSLRCDCGPQLKKALGLIQEEGSGIVFYLQQEGRGIGLAQKIKAYTLQGYGLNTLEANAALGEAEDARTYDGVVEFLLSHGINRVRLLSNNPDKIEALRKAGIEVQCMSLWTPPNPENSSYIQCKIEEGKHLA